MRTDHRAITLAILSVLTLLQAVHDAVLMLPIRVQKLPAAQGSCCSISCGWRIDTEAVKRLDSRNALR
jgi:hypothetical protein